MKSISTQQNQLTSGYSQSMANKRWFKWSLGIGCLLVVLFYPFSWADNIPNLSVPTQYSTGISSDQGIQTVVLPSGQTLYIKEDHSQPIVTIDSWVTTGSVNETDETNGISHFLEHLLFKGTERFRVGEMDRLIESKGATFNAATSDDFTHYYITIASPFFEEAFDLHADMLLKAVIPEEELARERKVVQEEINRALDNPQRRLLISLTQALFGTHGYGYDTLGNKELIASVPRERILNYYHYWYQPQHLRTVVVGDVKTEQVVELAKRYFKPTHFPVAPHSANHYEPPPAVTTASPPKALQVKVFEDPNISQAYIGLAFLGPAIDARQDTFALDAAMLALGSGKSSRLYQRLKEEKNLVNSISAGNWTQKYAGLVYVLAELKPENLAPAREEILKTLIELKETGILPEELEKSKTQTLKEFIFLNESTEGVAETLGYNVAIGQLSDYTDYAANIQKVTYLKAKEALNKYLDFNHAVVVEVIPQGSRATEQEQTAIREQWTQFTQEKSTLAVINTPPSSPEGEGQVLREELPNGMVVLMKPRKASETTALRFFIRGGKSAETLPGISTLVANLMMKGTETRSTSDISQELEAQGIGLSIATHDDYMDISTNALDSDLGELFLILQDIVTRPSFDPQELAKEKDHLKRALQSSRDEPSAIALENLSLSLYPKHPYGNVGKRIEVHLDHITRDDLLQYYQAYFVPKNMIVSAVGNFKPEVLKHYLLAAFPESLNRQSDLASIAVDTPPVPTLAQPKIVEESKPQQAATWIAKGWLGPEIDSRDYVPLKVLNSLLGTGMSSRLFVNLREKQGLAYTVASLYPSMKDKSHFVLYIGTDPKNQEKVIKGFEREITRLKEEPADMKELQEAKNKLSGAFALAHETNASQAFYLGFYELMGLGYAFDTAYPPLIQQVTARDLQRVARRYFSQPSILSIVAPNAPPETSPPNEASDTIPKSKQ